MEKDNSKNTFRIEDYWDLSNFTNEQFKQLNVDLSQYLNKKDKDLLLKSNEN